jgi:hypothetical protein
MSRRLIRVNTAGLSPLATLAVVLFFGAVWLVSFCGTILLSGIAVYLFWLLGRFLIG